MVDVLLVAAFLARKPFQDSSRILARGARVRLQGLAHLVSLQAVGIQRCATKGRAIRQRGYGFNSKINAQHTRGFLRFWDRLFDLDVEVKLRASPAKYSTGGFRTRKRRFLPVANVEQESFATHQHPQADCPGRFVEREDPNVIVNAGRLEQTVSRSGPGKPRGNTGKGTNREIGRKTKLLTHIAINRLLECKLLAQFVCSPVVCDEVAGICKGIQCVDDARFLVLFDHEFAGNCAC